MSFNNFAQNVRDTRLSFATRRIRLNCCIGSFCWLTKQSYRKVHEYYSEKYGFDNPVEQNPAHLLAALDELIAVRNRFLEKLHAFERKRIREKMRGKRRPIQTELEKVFN